MKDLFNEHERALLAKLQLDPPVEPIAKQVQSIAAQNTIPTSYVTAYDALDMLDHNNLFGM